MSAVVLTEYDLEIPSFSTHEEFRRWILSGDVPPRGRFDFLDGRVEVDMSPKSRESHSNPEKAILRVLFELIEDAEQGEVHYSDMLVSHPQSGLSAEPDIVVLLNESIDSGRVQFTPKSNRPDESIEVVGSPDLIVEVVSDSSVAKDTKRLVRAYFEAGVREYWIVDARGEAVSFRIMIPGAGEYVETPSRKDGFISSPLLQIELRLSRAAGQRGASRYQLDVR